MWEPQPPTTLRASMACTGIAFTFAAVVGIWSPEILTQSFIVLHVTSQKMELFLLILVSYQSHIIPEKVTLYSESVTAIPVNRVKFRGLLQ
jgi:hypothetical protein